MQRKKSPSPLGQQVKGIFFFKEGEEFYVKALELMKSMDCTILQDNVSRITVKTSRGNLQSIKSCWLSTDTNNTLSVELKEYITQILIGGNA